MEQYLSYLRTEVGGNTLLQLLTAAVIFCAVYVVLRLVKHVVIARLVTLSKKSTTSIDDMLVGYIHGIKQYGYFFISLIIAMKGLKIPAQIDLVFHGVLLVVIVSLVIGISELVIAAAIDAKMKDDDGTGGLAHVYRLAIRFLLWAVGLLLILSNLGINVNSLIAGLGIGGLAISLALQNVLSDIFSSFSIAVDKPFQEGDFIVIGEYKGTVKHIGLKTTRIQALQGEEIVISNAELTTAKVQNFKKMERRRIIFEVGVTYETSNEKLKQVDDIIKNIIESQKHVEFDRVHFKSFGDSNLIFEVVYYMTTSDYYVYMDTQQAINFGIHDAFAEMGIDMAYPTRTVYMKNE